MKNNSPSGWRRFGITLLGVFALPFFSQAQTPQNTPPRGTVGDLWADVVVGKAAFTDDTENATDGTRLFNVGGVLVDHNNNRLFVYDSGNNRVLVLNSLANVQEGVTADFALGQMTLANSAGNGDSNFQNYPNPAIPGAGTLLTLAQGQISTTEGGTFATMAVDSKGNLYVPDFFNNRVLRYNAPFSSGEAAVAVWGQPDFKSGLCNQGGGPNNTSLCLNIGPDGYGSGVAVDSQNNLWVADDGNQRVLRFSYNSSTGMPQTFADAVIGQADFNSNQQATGSHDWNHLRFPTSVRVDGSGTVYITDIPILPTPQITPNVDCDKYDGRILVFPSPIPTVNATAITMWQHGLANPGGLELDTVTNGIWVDDFCSHQTLLFVNGNVTKVLGQDQVSNLRSGSCTFPDNFSSSGPDFQYADGSTASSSQFCQPRGGIGVDSTGNVFLSSVNPQDVWRFPNPIPTLAPTPSGVAYSADMRVFKGKQYGVPNDVSLAGLGNPLGVAVAGTQLIVADEFRLLYWNNAPNLTNGQLATGYADVTDPSLLQGNPFGRIRADQNGHLWSLRGIGGEVSVGSPPVFEVLTGIQVYSVPFTSNGATPIMTITSPLPIAGQAGVSLNWIVLEGIAPDPAGDQVWVSDKLNNRVFRIRNPLTNPVVDIILGQPNATSIGCNQTGKTYFQKINNAEYCDACEAPPTASTLYMPGAVRFDHHGSLYVSDSSLECWGNYRMLRWDASQFPATPSKCLFAIPATAVYGQANFTSASCIDDQNQICKAWEPAFNSDDSVMVVGSNPINSSNASGLVRFPVVIANPRSTPTPAGHLKDFTSQPFSADIDGGGNLYMVDEDRNRLLVYLNPFPAATPGSPTPTATVTRSASPTPTISPTSTVGGGCGASSASLQLKEFTTCGASEASQTFEVINTGTTALSLSQITFKVWGYDTTGASLVGTYNYGGCIGTNCSAVTDTPNAVSTNFSPACGPDGTHQANWEITFSNTDSRTLGAGATWVNIQTVEHLSNWANLSPGTADWYSPCNVGSGTTYTDDLHYAVYYQGALVTASGGVPPSCRQAACASGPATPAVTATSTSTPTLSPTFTPSPPATATAARTATFTPTATPSLTATATPPITPTFSPTGVVSTVTSSATASSTSSPSPSRTPTVSSTTTGTPTRTVSSTATSTLTRTATSSPTRTPTFTPTGAVNTATSTATPGTGCGTSSLGLQLEEFGTCGSNQNQESFEVINKGTSAVTFSDITIKFWADDTTSGQGLLGAVNYGGGFGSTNQAVNGVGISNLNFSPACGPDSTHQANWEMTVSTTDTRTLSAGATWASIQTATHLANWANFSNSSIWYSPCNVGGGSTYANDLHYALYVKGNLVTASGGMPPSCRPVPTCPPGGMAPAAALAASGETPTLGAGSGRGTGLSFVAAPNVSKDGEPIRFQVTLESPAQIQLNLFAMTGEQVYQATAQGSQGANNLLWSLENQAQEPVASGLYIYVIQGTDAAGGWTKTGKVAVLR